jgi:hypothetical protein
MKKPAIIAAGAVLIAIAGWSGLWFAGRGAVADRLDRDIARLGGQGIEITHGAREIGGFPFAYQVTHRDFTLREPSSGAVYRLPEVTTEVTAADMDRLVTKFPATFRIEVPLDEAQRAAFPGMPEVLGIDVEASGLTVVSDGLPGAGQDIAITAESLLAVTGSAGQPLNFAIELVALDTKATLPALSSGLPATGQTTVGRLDYAYTSTPQDGVSAILDGSIDNLRLTGNSNVRDQAGLMELLAGGDGSNSFTYQTGASQGAIRVVEGPDRQGGTLAFSAGSTAGTFSIADGLIEIATTSRANRVNLSDTASAETPPAAVVGAMVGAGIRSVELGFSGPFAPSETMTPVTLRFALDQVVADDAFWQAVDAAGKLPRDPAQMVIDVEATGRITRDMTNLRPGEAPPIEVGNVSILSADIAALGASIVTRGDVEFLQPVNLPIGSVTVTLTNALELMGSLAEAGLIDPATVQTATLMAMGFTVPGAAPGKRLAEIAMTLDGITVNGQPVGGGQ